MRQVQRTEAEYQHWPILEPVEGERERPIALNKPVCVAGDRVRVNLPLPDQTVSRAHILFVNDEDGVYVRDLASLNRILVNDEPVTETVLDRGDKLRIGPYVFRCDGGFRHDPGSRPQVPPVDLCLADDETRFHLAGRTMVIGTRENCDIRVSDERVAPAHAVLFEREGRWFVRDLRSKTGTFVNDRRIGQIELTPGDFIRIGDTNFRYEMAPVDANDTAVPAIVSADPDEEQAEPELRSHKEDWDISPLVDDSQAGRAAEPEPVTASEEPAGEDEEAPIPSRIEEEELEVAHSGSSHPGQIQSGSMDAEIRMRPPH